MANAHGRRGFSLIELLIVIAIITALAGIVSVGANSILKRSRETAALAHVQTLQKAQTQFYSVKRRYASNLKELCDSKLIPEHLASGKLGGYLFDLTGNEDDFTIQANPERHGKTGDNSYYTDGSLVIRYTDQTTPADRESPPVK
jgi:prepilin-type N-terminal cleavage/methylation domain-containing protein